MGRIGVGVGGRDEAVVMSVAGEPGIASSRPVLGPGLTADEFRRWYYLKTELTAFARQLGVATSGSKELIAARISSRLSGGSTPAALEGERVSATRQLERPVTGASVIPLGQRCSQVLREFFVGLVGQSFRFDAPMRNFVAGGAGRTLDEAVDHWRATRDQGPASIGPQFELNRFTRGWYLDNPGGTRDEVLTAWRRYRSEPEDTRGRA